MITVDLPSGVGSKQLSVKFSKNHLTIAYTRNSALVTIIDADTTQDYDNKESQWQIETENDKKQLIVHLHKLMGNWWSSICKGDEYAIDVNKMDAPTISISELGDDARHTVEKMMYDQYAKANGKPSSEDIMKRQQIAKLQAMYPNMDFSQCDFSNANFQFQ